MQDESHKRHWRNTTILVGVLLVLWFTVSFGMGILFVEPLNQFMLGGFPFGFWMAQQGAIFLFVLLILAYCLIMDRLDSSLTEDD